MLMFSVFCRDLYQQLLKELVEGGRAGGGAGDWQQAAAKQHRAKLHRNVDRKASKGRKTRYTVQKELVNFMAPRTLPLDDTGRVASQLAQKLFGRPSARASEAKRHKDLP